MIVKYTASLLKIVDVVLTTKVSKKIEDYTLKNQSRQNIE